MATDGLSAVTTVQLRVQLANIDRPILTTVTYMWPSYMLMLFVYDLVTY